MRGFLINREIEFEILVLLEKFFYGFVVFLIGIRKNRKVRKGVKVSDVLVGRVAIGN